MSDLKTPEYFLKQNSIEIERLKEDKPMLYHNICKAMSFYAEHYHIVTEQENERLERESSLPIGDISGSVLFKKESHFGEPLTLNKKYKVYAHYGNFIAVVDDNDQLTTHHEALFELSTKR